LLIRRKMENYTQKLRIGEIRYANCTPIYTTLKKRSDCSGYEFVTGVPSTLNRMLAEGGIDVSASSSIEYARHQDEYLVMPGMSISSFGDVGSILLFSKVRVEKLGGGSIALTSASATSTVLLKVLLRKLYRIETSFSSHAPDLGMMLSENDAALIIGDEALKEQKGLSDNELYVYDLGRVWTEFTGLPFVFALWMVRKDSSARIPGLVQRLKEDLVEARMAAVASYGAIAANAPEREWMGERGLLDYWRAISYSLDDEHVEGLMRFYDMAHELGEAPAVSRLGLL
jgi:chorismate dehydratase